MQKLSLKFWQLFALIPFVLVFVVLVLTAAILISPIFCIGFIFHLRAKKKRMEIATDYKLKVRQNQKNQ
jgi:hypothetical protein